MRKKNSMITNKIIKKFVITAIKQENIEVPYVLSAI